MTQKQLTGECSSCESTYSIAFMEELVSQELPEHCPFCGEIIEELQEEYIEEDDEMDNEGWDD
jgi:predicted  nucleic acid-binding Zn-ribbon protein